jgi:peptidoglycan/LPS O-acetylase OafA/YrhL
MMAHAWRNNALRLPKALGDYAYSIYFLHFPLIYLAVRLTTDITFLDNPTASHGLLYVGVTVVTLLISALTLHFFKRPAIKLGQAVCTKIARSPEGAPCNTLRST